MKVVVFRYPKKSNQRGRIYRYISLALSNFLLPSLSSFQIWRENFLAPRLMKQVSPTTLMMMFFLKESVPKKFFIGSSSIFNLILYYYLRRFFFQFKACILGCHSSEIRGLCLIKWPSKMFEILPYFWNMKNFILC